MAGDAEQTDDPGTGGPDPYVVLLPRRARRNLREDLPFEVAIAATETIQHAIAVNPSRVGKPLDEPFDRYYSARRGTYRIIYRIDEA
ncbi:type II toxin-antitoxin system RelE family toxin [Paractinoplanes hotanensis]|uniref:Type II toxin-antitoxin system RelE/ParE family toxin n=1 Tax=Paractinoplanes hotanensis TaxID=2906497 RepID=A0ABT0XZN8_9ACTN|nr:type II toxin-antitoxin system RelE/ParE family toxin [Actinoplanes hotanensis]MCM4079254.1 type II toxin-antitoxin system RelE/ParE family toxin [Actinoplanes hotanensis]